ncbi:MAG: bifunctional GTP diphosphokinase/guanosine-3',5'-bis pyrophosphate 3'-pyrophosphohydrolase [Pseudomonadales bacterium]|jgi:guanosine-3',5'-bis(diphosphate) 3'-pyrophosphohydrolase|nr:bifunctional GTP diphosphokinase/guanosine-3',5'-bis pyrophosphate 3'-pyrophosphohydrolase [Pseudomonadales bacterium]MCP5337294.1 bifunctional GTP diphosphokinase/guanosine-3',5'-bis pyrophosphate 3'-pyrophosphohydrolase [Pseudomonadales bacterium]
MQQLGTLTDRLRGYLAPEQVDAVRRAYYFAEQAHDGQVRRTGQPYVTHPLAVATILADMRMDHQSLIAALLHDVIEDTGIPKEALATQFGPPVAELVDGVSKLSLFETASRAEAQAENFQKMAMAMARDIRVILVKLADRLHNMRTLDVLKPEKRRRIAAETLEIYAPIALRLGMNNLRLEFEDLGFAVLHPMRARRIGAAVRKARGNRKELVSQIQRKIEVRLRDEGISARVIGREKHLYSIYRKMRSKGKSFAEIMDVFAFRIVVENVDTCYRVLGVMHNLYKPVPGHFKDYIAIPKANGYQSLHTVLFGMHGVPIEIQIRTSDMEEMANNGIAAHWLYKSSSSERQGGGHSRARQWVQGLLEMQQRAGNSLEFIESMKIDLFPDEVYVFTPRGEIFELPKGATAVDFAYAVHTDIGNSCVACRIDRNLAPLSTRLQSGQTVEIVTAPRANPNATWLSFVVTAKARTNIRHHLKSQQRSESIELGRRLLDKALGGLGSSIRATLGTGAVEQLLLETKRPSLDGILEEIGLGNRVALLTARHLLGISELTTGSPGSDLAPLTIHGTEGMVLNFAKCCYPIPGDAIVGHISAGRGMVVHRENCNNIAEFVADPERCTQLRWAEDVSGEFDVELLVELENQKGVIAALANRISAMDVNIEKIDMEERDARISQIRLVVGVANRVALARIMRRIRTQNLVMKVTRVRH